LIFWKNKITVVLYCHDKIRVGSGGASQHCCPPNTPLMIHGYYESVNYEV